MKVSSKELADFKSRLALVDIERNAIDDVKLYGFVLGYSDELILIREVDDFIVNGLRLIRRRDITKLSEGETGIFQRSLIEAEGNLQSDRLKFQGPLHSFEGWLSSFSEDDILIVEDETVEGEFYIGKVISANAEQVLIHNFDGAARWDDEISEVPTDRITMAQADGSYTNHYQRHYQREEK